MRHASSQVIGTAILLPLLLQGAGCGGSTRHLGVMSGVASSRPSAEEAVPPGATDRIEIQYLGCAGLRITRGADSILTGPFFSNPGLAGALGLLPISANKHVIEEALATVPRLETVRGILVGHSHYDHLMDVPVVIEAVRRARARVPDGHEDPLIYANRTAANILAPFDLMDSVVVLDDSAGDAEGPGEWIEVGDSPVRIMAILSGHAPHFHGIKVYGGEVGQPLERPPRFARGWKEGRTLTFLLDFLDPDGSVAFRAHYQDAVSRPPLGFPGRRAAGDGRPVDVSFLCVGGFREVEDYPEAIVGNLRPRHVVLIHWEDFFRRWNRSPRVMPMQDVGEFTRRLETVLPPGSDWSLPSPGATLRLERGADGAWTLDRSLPSDGVPARNPHQR